MNGVDEKVMAQVLSCFSFDTKPVSWEPYGCGHINLTCLVITESGRRYIMQRMNEHVTKCIPDLMNNINLVTEHLRKKAGEGETVLTLVLTVSGDPYLTHESGCWRVYDFVEHSLCLQTAETVDDFYQSAVAFGHFEEELKDFPIDELNEVIPDFHNTPNRYRIFHEVLDKDVMNRAAQVKEEIQFVLEREEEMGTLQKLRESGELPLRVTHNDTKLNNVLLDADTRKALCVIDLDTVMPGLSLYDYGDSIRFGAATAAEDEKDLSKVEMDLEKFRIYTRGFVSACPGLTDKELELLPMGAKTMTLECGMRFLTDYLEGDHYFAIHYPDQNLDRCRTQFKLVADMEKKWDKMQAIVKEECGREK